MPVGCGMQSDRLQRIICVTFKGFKGRLYGQFLIAELLTSDYFLTSD